MKKMRNKIQNEQGIAWIFVILSVLILILLWLIFLPVYRQYRYHADEIGCVSALKTANDQLAIAYLSENEQSAEEAKEVLRKAMGGWEDLCVAHGTIYLVEKKNSEVPYGVVCGLHDKDTKERTRLNASHVLEQIEKRVKSAQIQGEISPENVSVELNGKKYEAALAEEENEFRTGNVAKRKREEEPTICYAVAGSGEISVDSGAQEGEICYFSYADKYHYAIWNSKDGWLGDSYGK